MQSQGQEKLGQKEHGRFHLQAPVGIDRGNLIEMPVIPVIGHRKVKMPDPDQGDHKAAQEQQIHQDLLPPPDPAHPRPSFFRSQRSQATVAGFI